MPNSVEGVGIGDGLRDACQKGWTEGDRQRRNGGVVDPALDGPRETVEFGKDRAKRPADNGVATIRAAGPPNLHEQRSHERDRRIVERAVAVKETLNDRLAG